MTNFRWGEKINHMSSSISPVTGIIEENNVIIDFGQWEGRSVSELHDVDPSFYQQLIAEKENDKVAIRRNRDKTFRLYINPLLVKSTANN